MSDEMREMRKQIHDDNVLLHAKIDAHIESGHQDTRCLLKAIAEIDKRTTTTATKVGAITAGIALVVSGAISVIGGIVIIGMVGST